MGDEIALDALHEMPWSEIEGAYIKVKTGQGTALHSNPEPEVREGVLAGRHTGWKVKYDSGRHEEYAEPQTPIIAIETEEETYLEVLTDTLENELLEFEPTE